MSVGDIFKDRYIVFDVIKNENDCKVFLVNDTKANNEKYNILT